LKISIITPSFNNGPTIRNTIESIAEQQGVEIEHIVIDGASKDQTVSILENHPAKPIFISEPDKGIYDAMNKGIRMATGAVVGILNADDFYPNNQVLIPMLKAFEDPNVDAVIGDILFVDQEDTTKAIRHYSAKDWHPDKFVKGFMPPHPAFFVRKKFYDQLGLYQIDYKIAADYELLIRFLKVHQLRYQYIPQIFVHMRAGGVSNASIKSRYILNQEIVRACQENGLQTNMLKLSLKYFKKIREYVGVNTKTTTI